MHPESLNYLRSLFVPFLKAHSLESHGAHRSRENQAGTQGSSLQLTLMALSTRKPSKPLTQGQFHTLKFNYGARMGSSVLGSSWENRVSHGEDRRTPLRGVVTGMAPCLGTSSEP